MKPKFLVLIIVLLGIIACQPQEDKPGENEPEVEVIEEELVLKADALTLNNGAWVLDEASAELQERDAGLILTAQYINTETQAVGSLTLTRYKEASSAQQIFTERQTPEVEEVSSFGDGAFLLNNTGVVLADSSAIAEVQITGENFTRFDLLGLLQVGVDALRDTSPPQNARGYLGASDTETENESEGES